MLKILFSLLLLVNGGLFAFQHGYLAEWIPSTREPARMQQQLHADKLQLLPAAEAKLDSKPEVKSEAVVQSNDAKPANALDDTVAAVEKAMIENTSASPKTSANATCTEIGNFDVVEAKRFEKRLTALSLKEKIKRRAIADSLRHIVYMPPQENRAGAEKKAAELKSLGVNDFFIIQDDSPLQWGISLGVFKTEEAARKHLADLDKKGVRTARVSDRGSSKAKVAFQLSGLNADARSKLKNINADFPRQKIRSCTPLE